MILALVKVMTEAGYDPAQRLWVQAIDVERMAALMCYIQLSLWNVPAEVIVGNTLSWEIREVWYTPAHHLHLWKYRLTRDRNTGDVTAKAATPAPASSFAAAPTPEPVPATETASEDAAPTADAAPDPTPTVPDDNPSAPGTPSQLGFDF
jgi:hypothetical protein